jgi:hypothetical protein
VLRAITTSPSKACFRATTSIILLAMLFAMPVLFAQSMQQPANQTTRKTYQKAKQPSWSISNTYKNKKSGFSFKYPTGWQIGNQNSDGVSIELKLTGKKVFSRTLNMSFMNNKKYCAVMINGLDSISPQVGRSKKFKQANIYFTRIIMKDNFGFRDKAIRYTACYGKYFYSFSCKDRTLKLNDLKRFCHAVFRTLKIKPRAPTNKSPYKSKEEHEESQRAFDRLVPD